MQSQSEEFFQVDLSTNLFPVNSKELNKRLEKYRDSAKASCKFKRESKISNLMKKTVKLEQISNFQLI
jgi:hypothetical protein